jgi:peroxiredoxin
MPHIERVYKAVKDKNVAVLAVCVWDDRASYSKWVPANLSKYTFPLAFDPAGRDNPNSIAIKQFRVSGIPTTYIIGPDGNIADSIVGYRDGDIRLEEALKKLGVSISPEATR